MRRALLQCVFAILWMPTLIFGAVAFDALGPGSSGASGANVSTLSWTHIVGAGSNTLLVVGCSLGSGGDTGITLAATYNSVSMSDSSAGRIHGGGATSGFAQLFRLIAPAAGSHTVQVTVTGGAQDLECGSTSYTGVDQTTPLQNVTSATGTGVTPSVAVTSASGNIVIDVVGAGSAVASSSQTNRWLKNLNSNSCGGEAAQSTAAGAGSVTMSYTITSDCWAIIGADVKAAAGGSSFTSSTQDRLITMDSQIRGLGSVRTDAVVITDVQIRGIGRLTPDRMILSEAQIRSIGKVDTAYIGARDASSGQGAHFASRSDSVFAFDAGAGIGAHFASLTERVPGGDILTHQLSLFLLTSDVLRFSDAGLQSLAHLVLTSDQLGVRESGSGLGAHFALLTDTLRPVDTSARLASLHAGTSDLLFLSDLGTRSHSQFVLVSEAIGLFDLNSQSAAHFALVTDRWSSLDAPTAAAGHFLAVSDVMGLTEARLQSAAHFAAVTDRWSPVDTPSGSAAHFLTAREVTGFTDSQVRLLGRYTSEASYARESSSGLGAHFARPVELALLRDFSVAGGGTHNFTVTYIEGLPFHESGTVFASPFVLPAHRGVYIFQGVTGTYIAVPRIGVMR